MTTVFVATVKTPVGYTAAAETAEQAARRACEKGMEYVQRVYTNGHGEHETIGQHRICWARTASVRALPVWFDATTVQPPRGATILQRG
ncbi:hypothetical protein V4U86_11355 [Mycobacterium sp. AMU20-3851]|uniref:hypothetical protein n=1 Tax=Mycobacterium sp. AMU20-3851 TaxID=3122055 RepID=UPI003754294C